MRQTFTSVSILGMPGIIVKKSPDKLHFSVINVHSIMQDKSCNLTLLYGNL